ncbi:hypothetical protein Bpfe_025943 [Biomphalaria pfeifferi]|uniref:Transmembrane protein n=1 Tax=Biomphalaria pfeifferi TaxID=112525 RepID=A0AAD8B120_BIOPF|nr:hypothetical protein Bpfe_025943 [Biomphalaria pfeifferi]
MKTLLVYVLVLIGSLEALDPTECLNGVNTCVQSFTNDMKNVDGSNAICNEVDSYFKCIFSHGCSMDGDMKQLLLSSLKTTFSALNCNFSVEDKLNQYGNSASSMSSKYIPLVVTFSVVVVFLRRLTVTVY